MYPYDRPSLSHLHCGLIKPAVQNITVTILSKTIYTTCTPKHAEKMRIFLKWWMPIQNQGTSPPSRWNWTRLAANPQVLKPGALSIQQTRGLFMVIHQLLYRLLTMEKLDEWWWVTYSRSDFCAICINMWFLFVRNLSSTQWQNSSHFQQLSTNCSFLRWSS